MTAFCLSLYPSVKHTPWTRSCTFKTACLLACASACRPHPSMWVCRWVRATRTHYLYDGFSFLHHPISNHFCLSPTEPSHVSRARHKIPGHFLLQRGMIHISYIACKSLGQNCFDEALEVAGGRLALCLTLTVPRIQNKPSTQTVKKKKRCIWVFLVSVFKVEMLSITIS